ncbi:NlpC/P60 family protein [Henriciella sp.]|uniref:C40 family peptidase n=1 Tax=Henriciella sp. TaxID=1968823 RepID=UPI002628EB90|nr:NlpC/P60 family protein [Henriciella sp.]
MPEFNDPRLTAPANLSGVPMQVSAGVAAVRDAPEADAELATQALHGETLKVFEEQGGFARVQLDRDRYVGWAPVDALSAPVLRATHKITALRTYAYSEPHLKSAPRFMLSMGSLLPVTGEDGKFVRVDRAGWVPVQHVAPVDRLETDPAAVAERFLHAPYLWGGCESLGLDCTGLTRAAFLACGVILPRDSDMQFAWSGQAIEDWKTPGALQRGDLVFWKGHVGIMLDAEMFLHSNAHHMAVAKEPLAGAIERIAKIYGEPIGARRIDVSSMKGVEPDWLKAG